MTLLVLDPHPRNYLSLFVRCDVIDRVGDIHVPVNSCDHASVATTTTHVDEHSCLTKRVLFVVRIVIENFYLRAKELLRPVALFARLRGRTQIVNRRSDGTRIFLERDRIKLI